MFTDLPMGGPFAEDERTRRLRAYSRLTRLKIKPGPAPPPSHTTLTLAYSCSKIEPANKG